MTSVLTIRPNAAVARYIVPPLACILTLACDPPADRDDASTRAAAVDSAGAPVAEASAAAPEEPERAERKPPAETFALEPWKSVRKGVEPVMPPEDLLEPWRAFVNQERPRQKKNPKWQTLPPKQSITLQMPEGSSYRCQVGPLVVRGHGTEAQDAVQMWVLSRSLKCSSDGWQTFSEQVHQVFVKPDGDREVPVDRTIALLRERGQGDGLKETTVILRSDKQKYIKATTGPPQENPDAPLD